MVLMAPGGKIPKDRSWKAAKAAMARVDGFLDSLIRFDKEHIHENCLKALQPYLQDPQFKPELVTTKSYAAAGLCSWVVNIVRFHEVYCDVEPKRQALSKANAELAAAQDKLASIKAKIAVSACSPVEPITLVAAWGEILRVRESFAPISLPGQYLLRAKGGNQPVGTPPACPLSGITRCSAGPSRCSSHRLRSTTCLVLRCCGSEIPLREGRGLFAVTPRLLRTPPLVTAAGGQPSRQVPL